MSEEQRELHQLRQKSLTWQEREQQDIQQAQLAEKQERVTAKQERVSADLMEHLPQATDLPQTRDTAIAILEKMGQAIAFGKEISVPEAINLIRKDREVALQWAAQADPASIMKILKPEQLAKMNELQLVGAKDAAQRARMGTAEQQKPTPKIAPVKMTTDEWIESRRQSRGR